MLCHGARCSKQYDSCDSCDPVLEGAFPGNEGSSILFKYQTMSVNNQSLNMLWLAFEHNLITLIILCERKEKKASGCEPYSTWAIFCWLSVVLLYGANLPTQTELQ